MKCKVKNHESKSICRRIARRRNLVDRGWRMRGRRAGEFARTPVRIDIRRAYTNAGGTDGPAGKNGSSGPVYARKDLC